MVHLRWERRSWHAFRLMYPRIAQTARAVRTAGHRPQTFTCLSPRAPRPKYPIGPRTTQKKAFASRCWRRLFTGQLDGLLQEGDFYAAVELAPRCRAVVCHRIGFTKPLCGQLFRAHTSVQQGRLNSFGAAI